METQWHKLTNPDDVPSPALLVYVERAEENIRRMIEMVRDPARLRTHVKTHKMPALIKAQLHAGITKFKCATIAEAEMTASAGAPDVLLAMQTVGPNIHRFLKLIDAFPATRFSTILDDLNIARQLSAAATKPVEVLLDLDLGMHRTGAAINDSTVKLCKEIANLPNLRFIGLHAYDGHIHDPSIEVRETQYQQAFAPVDHLANELRSQGLAVKIVAGGTPTFPMHARRDNVECSPGTSVLSDVGYGRKFPDLNFQIAAAVLTRVVSKPAPNLLCLDLGHKSIASENPQPRAEFPDLPNAKAISHSEEHLVLETPEPNDLTPGAVLYAFPKHICPTVALYSEAVAITKGRAGERWPVTARNRILTF